LGTLCFLSNVCLLARIMSGYTADVRFKKLLHMMPAGMVFVAADGHHRLGGGSGLLPASADMQRAPSGRLPLPSALSMSR